MPHLLNIWPSVSARLRDAQRVLLLSDFDGTLTPIVDRPELAVLAPGVRQTLVELTGHQKFILGVLSGRSLHDLEDKVGVPGMIYAGNHGLEISGPGLEFVHSEANGMRRIQTEVFEILKRELGHLPGVVLENKGLTLSVHYRLAPDASVARIQERFAATVSPLVAEGQLKTSEGKKVLEVRPNVDWDKGKAIAHIQGQHPQAELTVFFGDDLTDEDGFAVVQESGGVDVFVGPARAPTKALYRLDSPGEVARALALMAGL